MNQKIIVSVILGVVVLGGLFWLGKSAQTDTDGTTPLGASVGGSGMLVATETAYDFGTISMKAGTVSRTFTIKNTGTASVTVEKMYTSCMCTTALLKAGGKAFGPYGMPGHGFIPRIGRMFNAGEEAEVEVVFDPAAHGPAGVGKIARVVRIETDAGEPLEFSFSAVVTP